MTNEIGGRVDFWQTVRACGRRWYLAIPVFVLVVGIALLVAGRTTHQYESTGTMVLSEPDPSAAGADHSIVGADGIANPLLAFADSLTTDASLLIQNLNSPAAQQVIAAQGGTATITASNGDLDGPFIVVVADDPDPAHVRQTVQLAFAYAEKELIQREKALGAPPVQYIAFKSVVDPTDTVPKLGGKSRFLGATVILALAASLTTVYAAETYGRRRQRTRPEVRVAQ